MESIVDLLKNSSIVTIIAIIILIGIAGSIYLIAKHWDVFKSLFTLTQNIPLILENQEDLKKQHIYISDQVKKIAAETIPNGSNKIRIMFDNVDDIKKTVTEIVYQQEISRYELEARLEVDKVPTFKCDSNGRCVFANSSLCYLFETTQDHMLGEGWGSFIIPKDQDNAFKNWHRFINSKGTELEDSYTIRTKSKLKHITYKAIAKYNSNNEITFIIGTAWDTKRRTKEDLECLFEVAEKIQKTSFWSQIEKELKT